MSQVNSAAQSSSEIVQSKVCEQFGHKIQLFIVHDTSDFTFGPDDERGAVMCSACGHTLEEIRKEKP